MKIKRLPNKRRVILELEELYVNDDSDRVRVVDELSKNFEARRVAYNMWEFIDYKTAEEFVFLYRLKHENSRKEN